MKTQDIRRVRRAIAYLVVITLTLILPIRSIRANKDALDSVVDTIPRLWGRKSTLALDKHHIRKIWSWEITNGHYPSHAPCEYYSPFPSTARAQTAITQYPVN